MDVSAGGVQAQIGQVGDRCKAFPFLPHCLAQGWNPVGQRVPTARIVEASDQGIFVGVEEHDSDIAGQFPDLFQDGREPVQVFRQRAGVHADGGLLRIVRIRLH